MGNKNSFTVANQPAVEVEPAGRYVEGIENRVDVLEGEEITPSRYTKPKMIDQDIDRQDSRAPLKDNIGTGAQDDAIVNIASGDETGKNDELVCGIGSCRPRWLQWVAGGPKAFALWAMLYLLLKTSGTVYIGSVIGTIEKQFNISSTESGAIIILNDAVDMALVIFVAYFGHRSHRPRIIAVGVFLAGLGITLCGIPHYLLDPYTRLPENCNATEPFVDFCAADSLEKEDPCQVEFEKQLVDPVWWLLIGQILLGIGNVPMKPLGTTYIDDAVGKHTTPVYIAFLFIAVSMGPIIGFVLGSSTLNLFVDFDRVPPEDRPTFQSSDPRFIGAWWLGFICIGSAVMALSLPFFFFPKHLPHTNERAKEEREAEKAREALEDEVDGGIQMKAIPDGDEDGLARMEIENNVSEIEKREKSRKVAEVRNDEPQSFLQAIKQMVLKYKKMLMNVGLLLLCLSSSMEGANAAALGSFALKYYNIVFAVSASTSALLGIAVFPFNLFGSLVGGYLIKRRKWSPAKCALFLMFGDVVSIASVPVFMLFGCQTQAIAGVSTPYMSPAPYAMLPNLAGPVNPIDSVQQAISSCNSNCTCGDEDYNPVCGSDGLTYVSPCYAGCEVVESRKDDLDRTINSFSDCRCISSMDGMNATATDGECAPKCYSWQVPVLIIISIIVTFCGGLGQSGLVLITLRIVEKDMRSAALGFQTVVLNLLGFFPAPVYFGAIFNLACILWSYDDGNRGACWVYDRTITRFGFHGLQGLLKLVAFTLFVGVYFALRTPKGKKYEAQLESPPNEKNEKVT